MSQQKTGTKDTTYDLVSVLYHALEGASIYDTYAKDAQDSGDDELAGFFRDTMKEERERAERTKRLLAKRLNQ